MVLLEDLWFWQNCLVGHVDRVTVYGKVPVLEDRLPDQDLDELVNISHLLIWIDATDSEAVTHARASSDAVRYSIDTAEFWWKMDHVFTMFDDNQRLIHIRDRLVVDCLHVFSHTDFLVVVHKLLVYGISIIVDITNLVGAFVTPISDYR